MRIAHETIHPICDPNINELWQVAVPQVSSTTQLDGSCYSMNFRKKTMDNYAGIDEAYKTTTLGGLLNIGLSRLVLLSSAGNLLHWAILYCPVQEHWVDISLHWAIPSCLVQEHWVDMLLHWVIPSCPLIVHYVVKNIVTSTRHDTPSLRLVGVKRVCLGFKS
jgi:hypothetical protein